MLLGRTKGGGDATHFSKNPALGTGSSAEPQLSTVEKSISDLQLTGNAIAHLLRPGGGGAVGALLVKKVGIVFPKYRSKGGGSPALHRVDFLNQGVNIRGHDEQIPDRSGSRIPIGMRRSPRYEDTRAGLGLDLVLSHQNAQRSFKHIPCFVVAMVHMQGRDKPGWFVETACVLPLGDNESVAD
jgi:hypothetical protein